MKKVTLLIILFVFVTTYCYSERYKLKTGDVIEGEVIGEDNEHVILKVKYGTIKIDREQLILAKPKEKKLPVISDITSILISIPPLSWLDKATVRSHMEGMYKWLVNQTDPNTGLLESYRPTADVILKNQASTYDQALAGMAFLILGDNKRAQNILEFYAERWKGEGFGNFYFTPTGNPGIESTAHLGPNMWIALLALHYDRVTEKDEYTGLAESIVRWAMKLPHYHGGAAMSDRDEWRAPWSKVISTENNVDYYTVLSILLQKIKDPVFAKKVEKERLGIIDFLSKIAYNKKNGGVYRGFREGSIDREYASDTFAWLISSIGIRELRGWGIDPFRLIEFVEGNFLVKDEGIKGFDFTNKKGSFLAKRPRMISIEWTLEMVNIYCIFRNYYYRLAEEHKRYKDTRKVHKLYQKSRIYEHKARFYLKEMDKKMLKFGPRETLYAYPYATRSYWLVFYDTPWWKTPKAGANGVPAGSVASTAWRIFATRFNPLNPEGEIQ